MQPLVPAIQQAADLYWLVFLLTGHRDVSIELSVEALRFQDRANPFFSAWMDGWSRKVLIAKALTAIRDELAESAGRAGTRRAASPAAPPRNWTLSPDTTKVQLERALLAIDAFPRCAVLLSVFEGLSLDDTTILLDADRDSIRKAQAIGFAELSRNLAGMQTRAEAAFPSVIPRIEVQHA